MTDHADIVREALDVDAYGCLDQQPLLAIAALDALVAERDEYLNLLEGEHMRAEAAEAEVARLREALDGYADHQSWRCEHPDRYPQDPDCVCGLIGTMRGLGWSVEYDTEGRAALSGGSSE